MSRILIVDDDQRIVQLLSDCFKHAYTVDIAMNGGEALAIVRRQRPDVVLLDLMLPGISGLHLLKDIKRIDPSIAVIVMTGHANAALAAEAISNGAASYLAKPFNLPDIDRLVSDIIAGLPRAE
jgi:DNA-binding NtrC family response regulator